MKISILMSVYFNEKAIYFNRAMKSIWDEQSIKPAEIVLVQDGKLTPELIESIKDWQEKLGDILITFSLEKNVGLALALNEGLEKCNCEFIARMDTDDIATWQRLEKQRDFLIENENIDIVGSHIMEIDENERIIKSIVKYPLSHNDMLSRFHSRDPLAHPTVMFRKRYFTKAGKYKNDLHMAEDTLLWYYGFLNNCFFANIDYVGLKFRRTSDFYKRRGNYKKAIGLLKYRLFFINRKLNFGIIADFYAVIYFLVSLAPTFIKRIAYQYLRK